MATQTYVSNIDHTNDVGFRAWAKELHDALIACGLVQTSDTGQINFTTATRPGTNQSLYAIYRFNDSLQSSRPVFIRLEYGTSTAAAGPQLYISVGTGTTGAGVLTGVISSRSSYGVQNTPSSTVTTFVTNVCVTAGAVAVAWKMGAQSGVNTKGQAFFSVGRSCDDTGAITGDWVAITRFNTNTSSYPSVVVLDFVNSVTYPESFDGSNCCIPQNTSSSLVGTSTQVYKHYVSTPRVRPLWHQVTVFVSEFGANSVFSTIPVGSTVSRTYIALGAPANYASISAATATCLAMIWE